MKRCPECRRDYFDDTLSFCLDDGSHLVDGPAAGESSTAILSSVDSVGESPTAILPEGPPTVGGPGEATTASSAEFLFGEIKRHRTMLGLGTLALLLLVGSVGFAIYKFGWPENNAAPVHFQSIKIEKLTSNGMAT